MNRIPVLMLAVVCLAGVAHAGMKCLITQADEPWGQSTSTNCPKPGESSMNSYCCTHKMTKTAYCCDALEWSVMNAVNDIEVAASSGYTTRLEQTSNILFYLSSIYFIVGRLLNPAATMF